MGKGQNTINSALSFVKNATDGTLNYWCPARANAWDIDCATGRKAASELVKYIAETSDFRLMGLVMTAIVAEGKMTEGVEIGFFTALSQFSIGGLFS